MGNNFYAAGISKKSLDFAQRVLRKSWRSLSPRRSRKRRATISRNFRISQSFPDQLTSFINLISFQKPFPRRVNFKMSIDDRNTEFNLWSVRSSSKVQSSNRRYGSVGNKYIYITHIEALIEVYLQFNLNIYFMTTYIPFWLVFWITKQLFNIFQLNLKSKTLYWAISLITRSIKFHQRYSLRKYMFRII